MVKSCPASMRDDDGSAEHAHCEGAIIEACACTWLSDPSMTVQVIFMQVYRWLIQRALVRVRSKDWACQDASHTQANAATKKMT